MAWGYGSDTFSPAIVLALATQAIVFLVLVGRGFGRAARGRSALKLGMLWMGCITGSTALYQAAFPVFGIGVTSGLLSLLITLPATVLNSIIFSVRAFQAAAPRGRGIVFAVVLVNLAYWAWMLARPFA